MNQQAYFELLDDIQAIADELETHSGYEMSEESAPVAELDEFNAIWEDR